MLYPSEHARLLTHADARDDLVLVVPDGTWTQAGRIARRDPAAIGAEHVKLPDRGPSRYALRSTDRPGAVSTIEAIAHALAILEGPAISPQTILLELMERVGLSGNYLVERDTRQRLRAGEIFSPAVFDRHSYEQWAAAGEDELAVATRRVLEIVAAAEERGPLLDAAQRAELEACVAAGAAQA